MANDPNPTTRVVGTEEQAREHVHRLATATFGDPVPQMVVVCVALAVLVERLEARVAELERRVITGEQS